MADLSFEKFEKDRSKIAEKPSGDLSYMKFRREEIDAAGGNQTFRKVEDYLQESADTVVPFVKAATRAPFHPIETTKKLASYYTRPIVDGAKKAFESAKSLASNLSPQDLLFPQLGILGAGSPQKVADTAKLITSVAEVVFSPITGTFEIAKKVPGAKQVAEVLEIPFTVAGFAGAYGTGKVIDWIPDEVVSQESKEIIKQPLVELGTLASQVLLGGKIMNKVGELSKSKKGEALTKEEVTKIVEEAKVEVKAERPTTEPLSFEQFKKEQKVVPKEDISRTSLKVQEEARQAGIPIEKGDLARVERLNLEENRRVAREEVLRDPEAVFEKLERPKRDVETGSLFVEMKKRAIEQGDVVTLTRLAKSEAGTQAGQGLKAFDDGLRLVADPVASIREVRNARVQKNTPKGSTPENVIKAEKAKVEPVKKITGKTWEDFIKDITC